MVKMKKFLSNQSAQEYLLFLAQHGNHYIDYEFNSIDDVRMYYRKLGINPNEEIKKIREYGQTPLKFTNFLNGNFQIESKGSTVTTSIINFKTDEEVVSLAGSGQILPANHWDRVRSSRKSFDKAIGFADASLLNEAIAFGVFAIEGYVNQKANDYNNNKSFDDKLIDNKQNKVRLEEKLVKWTEKIAGKKVIDKGNAMWGFFKDAISTRDEDVVHQKKTMIAVSEEDFVNKIKIYQRGVLTILKTLIEAFNEKEIPCLVIETLFYPEIESK